MRPRCVLRNLTRFGINMVGDLLPGDRGRTRLRRVSRSDRGLVQDFSVEHPHLHAARAVGRVRGRAGEVDVRAQGVQGHAPLAIGLEPGHLRAAEAAGAVDADALRAGAHGRGDRLLHGAAERHALLELLGDVLGHELGVEVGTLDLLDVQLDLLLRELLHLLGELVDLLALAADHQARPRRADADRDLLALALDRDLGDAGLVETLLEVPLDEQVLFEHLGVALFREPARVPGLDDPEPQADRIGLLTHGFLGSLSWRPPRGPGHRFLHVHVLDPHLALVERVRDRGLEHLLNDARAVLGRELQRRGGLLHGVAADQVQDLVALARRDAHVALDGFGFHGLLPGGFDGLRLLGVPAEDPRRHELAELVTHHVLGRVDGDELVAVVHRERVPDELGQHRAAPRPGLEHALLPAPIERLDLPHEGVDDVRPLLDGPRHVVRLPLLLPAAHDERIAQLATAGLEALGDLAPRRARVPAARGLALATAPGVVDGVSRDASHGRGANEPAAAAGLAERDVLVFEVPHLPDDGAAVDVKLAHFPGRQAELRVLALLRPELTEGARRACDGRAAPAGRGRRPG